MPQVVNEKPWWKSRTIVLNAASAVLLALEVQFGVFQGLMSPETFAYWALGLNLANVFLRVITTSPVVAR